MKNRKTNAMDKNAKTIRKINNRLEKQAALRKQIINEASDILRSHSFTNTKEHLQHGQVSVNEHSKKVTAAALAIVKKLHIKCDERDLIRGALLHDYFLYDWHIPNEETAHRLHGFYHPGTALRNAERDFRLTDRQRDIIKKHMWPMTVIPPKYKETWIVTCADKWVSLKESVKGQTDRIFKQ